MGEPELTTNYGKARSSFDLYLKATHRAPRTRALYMAALDRWTRFVGDPLAPSKPGRDDWVRSERGRLAINSFNVQVKALRSFYRWAQACGHSAEDLAAVWLPRTQRPPERLPRVLDYAQVGRLLAAPNISTFTGFRDHVLIHSVFLLGITARETVFMTTGCFTGGGVLIAKGGEREPRWLPVTAQLEGLLGSWLTLRATARPGKTSALWVTERGRALLRPAAVWDIVNRYAYAALGVDAGFQRLAGAARRRPWTGIYPHALRSTYAAELITRGVDLRAVQVLLGHESIHTTARYLGLDVPRLRAATDLLRHGPPPAPQAPRRTRRSAGRSSA